MRSACSVFVPFTCTVLPSISHSPQNSEGRIPVTQRPHQIRADSGSIFSATARSSSGVTPVMTARHLLFAVGTTVYIFVGLKLEERTLTSLLGGDYERYLERTPRFVPSVARRSHPAKGSTVLRHHRASVAQIQHSQLPASS